MNRLTILSAASALTVAFLAAPVLSQEIVVSSQRSTDAMVAEVSQDLDRQLDRSVHHTREIVGEGIAIVRFQSGDDGSPENVVLYRRSGDRSVDKTAVSAVKHLTTLRPLPASIASDSTFQANIVLANDEQELSRLSRKLDAMEAERIASSPAERAVLALGVMPRPKS